MKLFINKIDMIIKGQVYEFVAFDGQGNELRFATREEARAQALSIANASKKEYNIIKKF